MADRWSGGDMMAWVGMFLIAAMGWAGTARAQAQARPEMAALADRYEERARSEPALTGVWTACAAAARKRAAATAAEADAYAAGMAAVLTAGPDATAIDAARSPCPEAIGDGPWAKAAAAAGIAAPAAGSPAPLAADGPGRDLLSGDTRAALAAESQREQGVDGASAERESLDRLNRQGAAESAAATARIEADIAAGRRRRADYETAMARYAADKAQSDADRAAAQRAQADYDREMRAYEERYGRR